MFSYWVDFDVKTKVDSLYYKKKDRNQETFKIRCIKIFKKLLICKFININLHTSMLTHQLMDTVYI